MAASNTRIDPAAIRWDAAPDASAIKWDDEEGKKARREASDAELRKMADPTGSFLQNTAAGAGKFFNDIGLGVKQRFGLASREDVAEARRLDEPLMKTGGGLTGNIGAGLATLAPLALVPGANTVAGAAALGGTVGALQPYTSTAESLMNPAMGAAGGAGGQWLANKAGGMAANRAAQGVKDAKQAAPMVEAGKNANRAGYVIPPEDLPNPSMTTRALSGLSGKIKTAQVASERNQSVTNRLAKSALGVSEDDALTMTVLADIRKQAGQAYEAVASVGTITPTQKYTQALDDILKPFKTAAQGFPNAKQNPVVADIEALKSTSFDASAAVEQIKILRDAADTAYGSARKADGKALKAAADALEGAIEEHLIQTKAPADLVKNFREARKLIAKTYTVQKGLNEATGNVSAQALAGDLKKGRPLSGELRTIAEAGMAFPKATQALKETPKTLSPLDFATAGIGFAGSGGSPLAAAGLVARPGARSLLLSQPMQQRMLSRAAQIQGQRPAVGLLGFEQLNVPLGTLGATAPVPYLFEQ